MLSLINSMANMCTVNFKQLPSLDLFTITGGYFPSKIFYTHSSCLSAGLNFWTTGQQNFDSIFDFASFMAFARKETWSSWNITFSRTFCSIIRSLFWIDFSFVLFLSSHRWAWLRAQRLLSRASCLPTGLSLVFLQSKSARLLTKNYNNTLKERLAINSCGPSIVRLWYCYPFRHSYCSREYL